MSESTSDEDLTTQYDDADSSAEDSGEEEETELETETETIAKAVDDAIDSLDDSLTEELDDALRKQFVGAMTTVRNNPGEAFSDPSSTSPRLAAITTRLNQTTAVMNAKGFAAGDGLATFLETVLGYEVPGDDVEARRTAATKLAHTLVTAVNNPTQAGDLTALATQLDGQSDEDYWLQLADDFDGTPASAARLLDHIVMMGLTIEMKPDGNFLWHNADQKAMFVDELIGASGSGPRRTSAPVDVDVASIYRRAASLTFNGQLLPRPIAAEVIRMALTELYQGVQPGKAALEVPPSQESLKTYLKAETIASDATVQERTAATARNAARASGLALGEAGAGLTADTQSAKSGGTSYRVAARSGRGQLAPLLDFLTSSSDAATQALKGGSTAAKAARTAISKSGIRDAVSAWDALYRSGETDPVKIKKGIDGLTTCVDTLKAQLSATLVDPMKNPAEAAALSVVTSLGAITIEVAAEAGELLEGHQRTTDPLAAPHALVNEMTAQTRSRTQAMSSLDPLPAKGNSKRATGLDSFVEDKLKLFSTKPWCTDLQKSAGTLSTASTHDYASLSRATVDLVSKLQAAGDSLDKLPGAPTSPEYLTGRAALDAIAYAVRERLLTMTSIDPQTGRLNHFDTLADGLDANGKPNGLNKWIDTSSPITDVAKYWSSQKGTVKNAPTGSGFTDALGAWQESAAAVPPDPVDLAKKTYRVIQVLADYRRQVTTSGGKPADNAAMLKILDNIAVTVALRTAPA